MTTEMRMSHLTASRFIIGESFELSVWRPSRRLNTMLLSRWVLSISGLIQSQQHH